MAGGGQAGELDEDKLDKGTQTVHLGMISHADELCSGRSFPTAHLETGWSGERRRELDISRN